MRTRSQTKKDNLALYEVNIDFDEASNLWNSNKKKLPNGCYSYVCGKKLTNNNFCKKAPCKDNIHCHIHK